MEGAIKPAKNIPIFEILKRISKFTSGLLFMITNTRCSKTKPDDFDKVHDL